MRALTSIDDAEIVQCLRMLAATDAGTGFMHEAFDVDNPANYSRPWFAWANSLFGELMLEIAARRPRIFRALRG
jgi:meiotically up-regulated gene 157 (Mug157) protein